MAVQPSAKSKHEDSWTRGRSDEELERRHSKPRRELFTPRRVEGAPPSRALTTARITEGTFLATGERFRRVDSWTQRATAHLELRDWWIGKTIFVLRSEHGQRAEQCDRSI